MRRTLLLLVAIATLLASVAPASAGTRSRAPLWTAPGSERTAAEPRLGAAAASGHVIVKLKGEPTPAQSARFRAEERLPAGAVGTISGSVKRVRVPKGQDRDAFLAKLRKNPDVVYAEPSYARYPLYTPPAYVEPDDYAWLDMSTWTSQYLNLSTFTWEDGVYPRAYSWWLRDTYGMKALSAWKKGYTGTTAGYGLRAGGDAVKVAVIDTGFYTDHPDKGANIVPVKDFFETYDPTTGVYTTDLDVTPAPTETLTMLGETTETAIWTLAHGTCTAGEIGAATRNGIGVVGAGYDTRVLVYKVMGIVGEPGIDGDNDGDYTDETDYPAGSATIFDDAAIAAVYDAVARGAKVISISLGGPEYSQAWQDVATYAWNRGSVIVAATGNGALHGEEIYYPAACDNVFAVGSFGLDKYSNRQWTYFSNYRVPSGGNGVDLLGPGEMVWGLTKPDVDLDGTSSPQESWTETGYAFWDGTSMATPAVAAGLALLWRAVPALTPTQLVVTARNAAIHPSATYPTAKHGYGYFDVNNAYQTLINTYPRLAKPTITAPDVSPTRTVNITWSAVAGTGVTYDVTLDGSPYLTGTTLRSISPVLAEGPHTVTVQPKSAYNWWGTESLATKTITVDVPVPQIASFSKSGGSLVWTHNMTGLPHTQELAIDGVTKQVTGTSYSIAALPAGSHDATLTVYNELGQSHVARYSFDWDPAEQATAITLTPSTTQVVAGTSLSLTVRGTNQGVPASLGGLVTLESSADKVTWKTAATRTTSETQVAFSVAPKRNTYYRARIAGVAPAAPVLVAVAARVGTPSLGSPIKVGKSYPVRGTVYPGHAAGSTIARLYVYRKVGADWVWVTTKPLKSADGSTWSVLFKASRPGQYRLRTQHSDSDHVGAYSAWRSVTAQ